MVFLRVFAWFFACGFLGLRGLAPLSVFCMGFCMGLLGVWAALLFRQGYLGKGALGGRRLTERLGAEGVQRLFRQGYLGGGGLGRARQPCATPFREWGSRKYSSGETASREGGASYFPYNRFSTRKRLHAK
jgi:hypothetical protein